MQIKNKVAIITGASSGIGLATARLFSQKGAKVVLAARSKNILTKLEKELPGSLTVPTDMTKSTQVKNMIQKTLKKFGRIDILVNNAGRGMSSSVEKTDLKNYREIIELNIIAPLAAMQLVIPIMRQQNGGTIVNVSSLVSKGYYPGIAAYASTKYALNALSLTAREELKKDKKLSVLSIRTSQVQTFSKMFSARKASREPNTPAKKWMAKCPPPTRRKK